MVLEWLDCYLYIVLLYGQIDIMFMLEYSLSLEWLDYYLYIVHWYHYGWSGFLPLNFTQLGLLLYTLIPLLVGLGFYPLTSLSPLPLLPPPRNGGMAMAIPMTNLEDWLLVRMIDKYNLVRFLYTVMSNKQLITAIISKKKKNWL